MRIDRAITKRSFIRTTLLFFLLTAGCMVGLFWGASVLLSNIYSMGWNPPVNMEIPGSDYEERFREERYDQLTVESLRGTEYLVYDKEGNLIHCTDPGLAKRYSLEDALFFPDVEEDETWTIAKAEDKEGMRYYMTLYRYDWNEEEEDSESGNAGQGSANREAALYVDETFMGSCVLDKDFRILEGGELFPGREQLSQREMEMLRGVVDNCYIYRYEYQTKEGADRILMLFSPLDLHYRFNNYGRSALVIAIFVLGALLLVILLAYLLQRRIKTYLRPLDAAIQDYGEGRRPVIIEEDLVEELRPVAGNFSELMDHLDEAEEEKERIYRERQQVIADLSHDLRTPLTVIQGYSQALQEGRVPESKRQEYLATIHDKSIQSADMINMLFDYTRIEHPEYEADRAPVDLTEVTEEYLENKERELSLHGDRLQWQLPEESLPYDCDLRLFYRLYDNLIGNAVKHNEPGIRISFRMEEGPEAIRILIADDGVGIPREVKAGIFDPFTTGNRARTSGEGTGLGMNIAKKIVDLHDGSIRLLDPPEEGFGAEFEILLYRKGKNGVQ